MLHAGNPMQVEKQLRDWQLVFCYQIGDEDTHLSEKTTNILRHEKDCYEEDGACPWAKYKIIISAEMPDMKRYGMCL